MGITGHSYEESRRRLRMMAIRTVSIHFGCTLQVPSCASAETAIFSVKIQDSVGRDASFNSSEVITEDANGDTLEAFACEDVRPSEAS
eukprot:1946948-Amphidinium_carterae.1